MKYIKEYNDIKTGKYVILHVEPGNGMPLKLKDQIGIVKSTKDDLMTVYFPNKNETLYLIHKNFAKYKSNNIEDLEQILNVKKYNL